MRRFLAAALCGAALCGLTACGNPGEAAAEFYAMDTNMRIAVYGDGARAAADAAEAEVNRLERLLSRTRADSAVSALNAAGGAAVDVGAELCRLLDAASVYAAAAGGAFDITVAPLADAWGFTKEEKRVPSPAELDALLPRVGMEHVRRTPADVSSGSFDTVFLDPGSQIDLGGIAKGYASDCVEAVLAESGVTSAMAALGGNVYVRGTKPDGSAWRVGVQDPNASAFVGILSLTDSYAVTSGGYQRRFTKDGKTYHHILNPETGYPADGGLSSVTVVAPGNGGEPAAQTAGNGAMCDALSTALYVLGTEAAVDFWRTGPYDFQLVLVTDDGRVLVTAGLADRFEQEEASGYTYETIPAA